MACCYKTAKLFLLCVNTLFTLVGVATVFLGYYGILRFSEFSSIVSVELLQFLLSIGIFIFVMSLLGSVAAHISNKVMLSVYAGFLFVILSLELVVGIMVGVFTGKLNMLKNNQFVTTADLEIQNVVNCTYALCCQMVTSTCHPNQLACNTTTFQLTLPYAACEAIDSYDTTILTTQCTTVSAFSIALYDIFYKNLQPIGIGAIAMGVTQLVCLFFACYLLCSNRVIVVVREYTPKPQASTQSDTAV